MLKGNLKIGDQSHNETFDSNLILLDRGDKLSVKANKKSEFLFIAGKPIGEPIARGGPCNEYQSRNIRSYSRLQ